MWKKAGAKTGLKDAVNKTVTNTLVANYKKSKKTPEDFYKALLENNTTHFTADELERLLAAFKRVTSDRLSASHFYEVVEAEMGWTNLLLRKQLFKAFDFDNHGDINFTEFAEGYSTVLRGTVPEMLEFAWRVYHIQGPPDLLALTDVYTILRLALAGLEGVRRMQGSSAGGSTEDTRFPERAARQVLEGIVGERQAPLTKEEFNMMVMRHRRLVDCVIPGFELIPQDPLHRAAEAGETVECSHLLDVDLLDVDGRDGLAYPTTPLHLAAKYGHAEVVAVLLSKGANMRLHSKEGETAIEIAVRYGRMNVLELLLQAGCDVEMPNRFGKTSYHTAAQFGQYKALRALMPYLEHDVTDLRDEAGASPLHCAALTDQWQVVDIFVEYDRLKLMNLDTVDKFGRTALHTAAENKAFRVTRRLVELGADAGAVDYGNLSVLNLAVRQFGNEPLVNLLLSNEMCQVDRPDDNGTTPLKACCEVEDMRVLRALLAHSADANIADFAQGQTALHVATIRRWLEGVDALLAPGVDCKVLRDKRGYTALDYARTAETFELLRDYAEAVYPNWTETHPVHFYFGITFDEGRWKLQEEGDLVGTYLLKRPRVSKAVAAKRMEHKMIDRNSLKKQLRKAGLVVLEEQVRSQESFLGVKTDIHQYTLFRVGAPLYRIQQEAVKMRTQSMRTDIEKREDFYLDHNNYPNTGFQPFSLGEEQKIVLNIIQSAPMNESLFIQKTGRNDDPYVAGISIAHYKKYKVIHDFAVLHNPVQRRILQRMWDIRHLLTRRYWRRMLTDYFSENKHNEFMYLMEVEKYFGLKIGFYFGFLTFYTNWMIGPAVAGMVTFCLEFIPSRYDSEIKDSPDDASKFDDQYDHPLMFIYGIFLSVWLAFLVQGWTTKQKELAFRWRVDEKDDLHTPNPLSTAPVRLQFVNGAWQYRAVLTSSQKRERRKVYAMVSAPVEVGSLIVVIAQVALLVAINTAMEETCSLNESGTCGRVDQQYNSLGRLVFIIFVAIWAAVVYVINVGYRRAAIWLTALENHESVERYEGVLAGRLLLFTALNSYSGLFYFVYHQRDIDKAAGLLAALMLVGQGLKYASDYGLPYLMGREPSENLLMKRVDAAAKAKGLREKEAEDDDEGPEIVIDDVDETLNEEGEVMDESDKLLQQREELEKGIRRIYGNKPISDLHLPQETVHETFTAARDEVLNTEVKQVLEFTNTAVQLGYVALFGAVFPLAAALAALNNMVEARMDIWKYCTFARRPMAEKKASVGAFWEAVIEGACVLGITNHMFILAVGSHTMQDYFFPDITDWQRVVAAMVAQNFLLAVYFTLRVAKRKFVPTWVLLKQREPLRFVRDAYRAGCALRERRYRMLLANPMVPMKIVCRAEDIDEVAAERYLRIVRYLDTSSPEEKRNMLCDSSTTIQALTTTINLRMRGGVWRDEGERPTAAGLLRELVPVLDVNAAYVMGKKLREAAYHLWEAHSEVTVMGSKAATIMSIRQFACIQVGCTMPQAERYVRLVRYVEGSGVNPWERLEWLAEQHPRGLMQVLGAAAEEGQQDAGEPVPSELGPVIEPVLTARRAFEKADAVRRRMFDAWVRDKDLQHADLLQRVCEDTGSFEAQLERYLLIKRYCESLDERKRKDLLQYSKVKTLRLCLDISNVVRDGGWRDPGEPSFYTFTPPPLV
eukprot:CAMPEP_0118927864 /NCGR_PEP_ID=MMETSP1169-20130426/5244_1 /TAXON_ID=36882 /ORGANISM="Pyramimonas obovata, Strain CCMP722" /LENGTH=1671 /DNA_ID=CAMNT_0006869721 /DNA_START=246 /DNA_END=5258 /DNA_ORIENTATION=-